MTRSSEGKRFPDEDKNTLIRQLGGSESATKYVNRVEQLIISTNKNLSSVDYRKKGNEDRKKEALKISKYATKLIKALEPVAFNPDEIRAGRTETEGLDILIHAAISQAVPGLYDGRETENNFFVTLSESLEELKQRCDFALETNELLITNRGRKESEQNFFDFQLVFFYRAIFKEFPSSYDDGAFIALVEKSYQLVNYPSTNFSKRIRDALKRVEKIYENNKL